MTKTEYVKSLSGLKLDESLVAKVENVYGGSFPEMVKKVITSAEDTIFFDDDYRVLSVSEMLDAEKDLHVDFKSKGVLPLVDCGDTDFIVYHFNDDIWSKFNIVDETIFKRKVSIDELI